MNKLTISFFILISTIFAPKANAATCSPGYYFTNGVCCLNGQQCRPPVRRTCTTGKYCRTQPVIMTNLEAPNEKSPAVAFILELVLGFGVGHYYAGNTQWGIWGTVSSLSIYAGIITLMAQVSGQGTGYPGAVPVFLLVGGVIGKMTTLVAAPIVTYRRNRQKRLEYQMNISGGKSSYAFDPMPGISSYDPSGISMFNSIKRERAFIPASKHSGTLMFPILNLSF